MVVPCYNKEDVVFETLSELKKAVCECGFEYEIVLVDDGSSDGTLAELEKFAKGNKETKVVAMRKNIGKGGALLEGFRHSHGDLVLFADADSDLPPKQIRIFLEYIDRYRADIVIGSKNHPDSIVEYPFLRRFLSRVYLIINFILFKMPISDTQVGMKLFRRQVLEYAAPRMLVKKFAYDLELLVLAHHGGFHIKEAPIELRFRGWSGVGAMPILNIFVDTMAIWYRLKVLKYYDKVKA